MYKINKSYIIKCSYCSSLFQLPETELNFDCPHCGGTNDREAIVEVKEEKVFIPDPPKTPKPPKRKKNYSCLITFLCLLLFLGYLLR